MIALADENFAPFAERVKGVLKKVSFHAKDLEMVKKAKDAEFYMNALCRNRGRKMNPEKVRPVKGLIDEINERQNRSQDKPAKQRAQSASVSRSQSDIQHSPSLYTSKDFTRSSSNLKQNTRGAIHMSRSKLIIQSINDCLQEEGRINLGTR